VNAAAKHFQDAGAKILSKQKNPPRDAARLNQALRGAERALLVPEGIAAPSLVSACDLCSWGIHGICGGGDSGGERSSRQRAMRSARASSWQFWPPRSNARPRRWKDTGKPMNAAHALGQFLRTLPASAAATFLALFPIVDPFGGIPIFFTMTSTWTAQDRQRTAVKTGVWVFVILVTFLFFGRFVLYFFGISLPVLKLRAD
jgi:hypothetical protein